jgi:uncharacterized membrane protein YfcA
MGAVEAFALLAVLAGAGAQAITGIGFSLVCAPLLTLALGGGDGVRVANLLAIGVNLLLLRMEWRSAELRHVLMLLIPATLVAAATAWAIGGANPRALSVASGAVVLLAIGVLARGVRSAALAGRAGAVVAGAVSGAMNVAGGVGGPAVAAYALNADWPVKRMRATLATYFLGINVVSVATRGIPALPAPFLAGLAAAVAVGFGAGSLLSRRLDAHVVRSGTLLLAAAGACAAVVQGLR